MRASPGVVQSFLGLRSSSAWAVALATVSVGLAGHAGAAPWGVPLPPGPRKGAITPAGDTDAFVVRAAQGALLSATVRVPRGSDLEPTLTLRGPGGDVLQPALVAKGRGVGFSKLLVPETGLYQLEIAGGATVDEATNMMIERYRKN